MCICSRYVYKSEIKERLLVMEDVSSSRSAESLASIVQHSIDNAKITGVMVGQSYDGASVMSGVNGGVQAIIRKTHPDATYIHCMAHKLNLVLVAVCKDNDLACIYFNVLQSQYEQF